MNKAKQTTYIVFNIRGFSLIELMVVLAIISVITAIAVPAFIGVREKTRVRGFEATAKSAYADIQHWAQSSVDTLAQSTREIDTNCDGNTDESDMTNSELKQNGVAQTYVDCRNNGLAEKSPWSETPLWSTDESLPAGKITLLQSTKSIKLIAKTDGDQIILSEVISY